MISQEEIKSFLEGNDPEQHIVAIEFDYATDFIFKIKELFSSKKIDYKFEYKNILFKGVPGTGKSRTIDKIIEKHLN